MLNVGQGLVATDSVKLFEYGIPGLDVPGIYALGPYFTLNAAVKAQMGVDMMATVVLQDSFNLGVMFPPEDGPSSAPDTNGVTREHKFEFG